MSSIGDRVRARHAEGSLLSRVITAIQPNFLAVTQSCLIIWTTRWVQGCGVGVLATSTGAAGHR